MLYPDNKKNYVSKSAVQRRVPWSLNLQHDTDIEEVAESSYSEIEAAAGLSEID